MDRAFVITGENANGSPIAGVYFTNQDCLSFRRLNEIGFQNIEICEVKPESKQPSENTLYIYSRSSATLNVTIMRFDWNGSFVSELDAHGIPSDMIPPVSGDAAEKYLYTPRASLIRANYMLNGQPTPVFGIFIVKPECGKGLLRPDSKVLREAGLKAPTVYPVEAPQDHKGGPTLYIVRRDSSAEAVIKATFGPDGDILSKQEINDDPRNVLPHIKGNDVAERFSSMFGLDASPSSSRRSKIPPSSKRPSKIPPPPNRPSRPPPRKSRPPPSSRNPQAKAKIR